MYYYLKSMMHRRRFSQEQEFFQDGFQIPSKDFDSPGIFVILLAKLNVPLARNADDQLHAIKISHSLIIE